MNKQITVMPGDIVAGGYQNFRYAKGDTVATAREHFAAYLSTAITVEQIMALHWINKQPETAPVLSIEQWTPGSINSKAGLDYARDQMGPEMADLFLATRSVARGLINNAWLVHAPLRPAPPLGDAQLGIALLGAVVVVTLGVAGIAAVTYWGVDRNEKHYQLELNKAQIAGKVAQYAENMAARVAANQPLPPAPNTVKVTAAQERLFPSLGYGAAALAGGLAVYAGFKAFAKPKRRANPKPKPPPKRRKAKAKKKGRIAKKKNPSGLLKSEGWRGGYFYQIAESGSGWQILRVTPWQRFEPVVPKGSPTPWWELRIRGKQRQEFKRKAQATAALKKSGAPASRRVNPKKKKTAAKRNPKRKVAKKRTANKRPARKAAKKKAVAKRNPKKKAAKRQTKKAFLASQRRKGRSDKQAAADWKGKQRLRGMKKGKARRRA